jgi:nitrate reductase delta subunit
MRTFKVLSALLNYPEQEMIDALPEMPEVLDADNLVAGAERDALRAFVRQLRGADLLDLQENYTALFDRGRSLSLHLFEHVHGESKDRGQAMVDLRQLYRSHGLELNAKELPDFLPLFLEYLSQRPISEAKSLLSETAHILREIGSRLLQRGSPYAAVFGALLVVAGEDGLASVPEAEAPAEDSLEALDRVWEDPPVTFGGPCVTEGTGNAGSTSVIHFVRRGRP